jgi:hypothetical protein
MVRSIVVEATWDPKVSVLVATSEDIPPVTEAPSMDALMAKLSGIIQDLLEGIDEREEIEVPLEVIAHTAKPCACVGLREGLAQLAQVRRDS